MDRTRRESAVKTEAPEEICPTQNRQLQRIPSSPLGDNIAVQIGSSACVIQSLCCLAGGTPASPRERANPRANAGRSQATPSYARRLSSLVKCPLSDTEPRPATPGT